MEEREVKMAVAAGFVMPSLAERLEGTTITDRGEIALHAIYWDTDALALARAGFGVRHRNGVWTMKGPSRRDGDAVVREELETEAAPERIPEEIVSRLATHTEPALLHPVAELRTLRHRFDVAEGASTAEVVHDRVSVRDGGAERESFEEVEVEYDVASESLARRIVALILDAGGTVDPTGKYAHALRALGHEPPELSL